MLFKQQKIKKKHKPIIENGKDDLFGTGNCIYLLYVKKS